MLIQHDTTETYPGSLVHLLGLILPGMLCILGIMITHSWLVVTGTFFYDFPIILGME